jgi:prolyl-tRNA synthetase
LEKHFDTVGSSKKGLVGDSFAACDLVVAVALAAATPSVVPPKTQSYLLAVLERLQGYDAAVDEYIAALSSQGAASTPVAAGAEATPAALGDNAVLALLQQHSIPHETYEHVACQTAEDLVANVPINASTETHTKNLFFKDKKHGLFLVTHATKNTFSTKDLGKKLNLQGKVNLRLADEALLDEYLHVKPGCVGPLCMGLVQKAGDKETITFVIDQDLVSGSAFEVIHSHPLCNDMSVKMTPAALTKYFQSIGVEPVVVEFEEAVASGKAPANRPPPKEAKQSTQPQSGGGGGSTKKVDVKGETKLALQVKKSENFPLWYTDVITLSEMISYYDISGCYILRPWSYKMWELIQNWFNVQIEKLGVENSYFPMFVSQERLEKEKDHVEGFAPEVAWVTRSGGGELAKPIAVRPTSETIMYPAFSDWIKSHRDLPLKLNQWSNVVRWEFKWPTPFLRTREFLWQEGHTAHATFEDANEMVMQALELYRAVYEDLLAVPVVPGYKTEKEKFAGGFRTTTVEAYIAGSGRAIQGATSHNLGQNFGKMFDISFQNEKGESEIAWQTSWGLTTRTIGVMVMVHGDDTGLVLPPRIAPLQVVIVPIVSKKLPTEVADPYCLEIVKDLEANGIRVKYDNREIYNPGWKYNHWEQKGVPIRIEVGPRDMDQKMARIALRYNNDKQDHPVQGLGSRIVQILDEIQTNMFAKARDARDSHMVQVTEWKDFVPNLEKNNLVLVPWIGGEHQDWEEWVKNKSREESLESRGESAEDERTSTSVAAKTLCIPFKQPELPAGTKCIASGKDATCWVLWGRSY